MYCVLQFMKLFYRKLGLFNKGSNQLEQSESKGITQFTKSAQILKVIKYESRQIQKTDIFAL